MYSHAATQIGLVIGLQLRASLLRWRTGDRFASLETGPTKASLVMIGLCLVNAVGLTWFVGVSPLLDEWSYRRSGLVTAAEVTEARRCQDTPESSVYYQVKYRFTAPDGSVQTCIGSLGEENFWHWVEPDVYERALESHEVDVVFRRDAPRTNRPLKSCQIEISWWRWILGFAGSLSLMTALALLLAVHDMREREETLGMLEAV